MMPRTDLRGSFVKVWIPILLFGILWIDLIRQLSYEWRASEQYAFGWFVPFLALGLFFRRWVTRPDTMPGTAPWWLTALVALAALVLLPARVVFEINPDWPLPAWLEALSVVALSLHAMFLMGGRRWVSHFAFPIAFILTAVPWPYRIEHGLTQGLMKLLGTITVEVLDLLFGIPVLQRGNLIEVSTGVVGIDDACSGIRSFQSTLMGALFMGELYMMRKRIRGCFLAGGLGLAFLFNVIRTCLLTWRASSAGVAALERWHDKAGFSIFLASFACLWATAGLLTRTRAASGAGILQPPKPKFQLQAEPEPEAAVRGRSLRLPRGYFVLAGCWMLAVLGITEAWYRGHEIEQAGVFQWSARLPAGNPGVRTVQLPSRTIALLAYDFGVTGSWQEPDGSNWDLSFFRWKPRSVQSVIHARLHRPEICLPAAGFQQLSESSIEFFPVAGLNLPFRKYVYGQDDHRIYVFFCQWEDGRERQAGMRASKAADRIQSVLTGRRWLGQQTLELVARGCESLDQAEQSLRRQMPQLIEVERPGQPDSPTGGKRG